MEETLRQVFVRVFNDMNIDNTISRENFELWDSINHISLMVEIESEFKIELEPEEFQNMMDFISILNNIKNKL